MGNFTTVNNNGIHYSHRRTNTKSRRCPFNRTKSCLMQIVLKLERKTVLVVMSGTPTGLRISDIVVGNYDTVNGNIVLFRILLQILDADIHLLCVQGSVGNIEFTHIKTQCREHTQLFGLEWNISEAFQNIKCLKM